jgi:surface protein
MLSYCVSLKRVNFGMLDFSSVEDFSFMFYNCHNLKKINVSNFNTKKSKTFQSMFEGCFRLKKVDISLFNSSKCENIDSMFCNCLKIKEIDMLNWNMCNIKKIIDMKHLFYKCGNLNIIKMCTNFNSGKGCFIDYIDENAFKNIDKINKINNNNNNSEKQLEEIGKIMAATLLVDLPALIKLHLFDDVQETGEFFWRKGSECKVFLKHLPKEWKKSEEKEYHSYKQHGCIII